MMNKIKFLQLLYQNWSMDQTKIDVGNANRNGLQQHSHEYNAANNIDIVLISETHFTEKTFLHFPNNKYSTFFFTHAFGLKKINSNFIECFFTKYLNEVSIFSISYETQIKADMIGIQANNDK